MGTPRDGPETSRADRVAGAEVSAIHGFEPAVFTRMLAIYALSIAQAPVFPEASLGMPAQMLAGSQRIRRF